MILYKYSLDNLNFFVFLIASFIFAQIPYKNIYSLSVCRLLFVKIPMLYYVRLWSRSWEEFLTRGVGVGKNVNVINKIKDINMYRM